MEQSQKMKHLEQPTSEGNDSNEDEYQRKLSENDVKAMIRHQLGTNHRNTTFQTFNRKLIQALKTIENEKTMLLQYADFNVNDAFKVLVSQKKDVHGFTVQASKQTLSEMELNASLLSLPGWVVSGDSSGCNLFCKKYSKQNT